MSSWLKTLCGDEFVAARLSEAAQVHAMLRVEAAYSRAAGAVGKVPAKLGDAAAEAIENVRIDHAALAERASIDGLPVPGLVSQIKAQVPDALHRAIHVGLTSQDVMDTALILAVRDILPEFQARIIAVRAALADLEARFGEKPMMARTRMQAALPVTAGHRIRAWDAPWATMLDRLEDKRPRLLRVQLGGPVGTRESFDGYGDALAAAMAQALDLSAPDSSWHTDRNALVELAGWCGAVSGNLGKIGADVTLMSQQGLDEIKLSGGGSSSAMPHKSNPVQAEVLVALARESAGLQATMQHALVHEQERSGAAWTLEWLVLPRLLESCGASLALGERLLQQIDSVGGAAD